MPKYYRLLNTGLIMLAVYNQAVMAADILEAYRDAVASDPQLLQAIANREAGQEAKPQARAGLLPKLDTNGAYGRVFNYQSDVITSLSGKNPTAFNNWNYAITLTQPLYNRAAQYTVLQAESIASQSDADLVAAQQGLVVRVVQSYFGVLSALDNLTYRTAEKNAFARQMEQAKRRFEVGLVTVTDVAQAQARYDLAVADELDARKTLADAREALRQVTGKYYDQINVLDEKAPLESVKPDNPDAWVKIAMDNNPQIRSAMFSVESSRENIEVQRSGHYPTLDLKAQRLDTNSLNLDTQQNQVGVELRIPLFEGGAVSSQTRQAAYQHEAAKESLEQTQRQVIRDTRNSYQGLETARSRVKALGQAVISNRSALEATQAGYDVGTRTIVDVLNAERDLLQAIRDLSLSRYDYVVNVLQLLQAAGRISGQKEIEKINVWLRPPKEKQPN
jgi:outer membrane protein